MTVLGHVTVEHRWVWLYVFGHFPENEIAHINGVKDDNRLRNLRDAKREGNTQNVRPRVDNTSGAKGVHWCKNLKRWIVQAQANKKRVRVGSFALEDKDLAVEAYQTFVREHHKEFCYRK